jgi:hypothetical protein
LLLMVDANDLGCQITDRLSRARNAEEQNAF